MNPLLRFWTDRYRVGHALEGDSWLGALMNRQIVGRLLNAFPRAATRLFALSRGELARRVCVDKEGGSYRVFHAMYRIDEPEGRGDLLNRLLMQSPAAKAARNRRTISKRMLEVCLESQPQDMPLLVLAIGGGDGSLEADVIARSANRNVYYCSFDKDQEAVESNRRVMEQHGLAGKGFVFTGDACESSGLQAALDAARETFATPFDGIAVVVCHGITEYLDLGLDTNSALERLLKAAQSCMRPEGRLVISQTDFHDRVKFVERGLCWKMRLRDMMELSGEIEKAGWQIVVCEHEPMRLITMCMAVKSEQPHRRIDSPSEIRRSRARKRVEAGITAVRP